MKTISKLLLVGAVAVVAIAVSAAPSEAKRMKKAACVPGAVCSTHCSGATCKVMFCGVNGKWTPSWSPACAKPFCAPHC